MFASKRLLTRRPPRRGFQIDNGRGVCGHFNRSLAVSEGMRGEPARSLKVIRRNHDDPRCVRTASSKLAEKFGHQIRGGRMMIDDAGATDRTCARARRRAIPNAINVFRCDEAGRVDRRRECRSFSANNHAHGCFRGRLDFSSLATASRERHGDEQSDERARAHSVISIETSWPSAVTAGNCMC